MLVYEQEGLLEVDPPSIRQLCRSTSIVDLDNGGREAFEVHCALCDFMGSEEPCCRVAFYARNLKRSLVFTVVAPDRQMSWGHGREILSRLGFTLEDVNLKVTPVLLDVVLRDIPGFATPAEARKINDEKERTLAEHQKVYDNAPDSAAGKKAALKLNAEKRNQDRLQELRKILERLLQPVVSAAADIEALAARLQDLEEKLAGAEARADGERRKREMSESITAAAEKRIQELEKILVDVETSSADALKQKRKLAKLQGQMAELGLSLESAERALAQAQDNKTQLETEATDAQCRIAGLEDDLERADQLLESANARLIDEQAEKARLAERLRETELQIKLLNQDLEGLAIKTAHFDETAKMSEDLQAQLAENQQALREAEDRNKQLQLELNNSQAQVEALTNALHAAENSTRDDLLEAGQLKALKDQNEQLSTALEELRADYEAECRIRQDLDGRSAQDIKSIDELKTALARLTDAAQESAAMEKRLEQSLKEVTALQEALGQQKDHLAEAITKREELETELHQAHELIDALEKMVRQAKRTGEESAGVVSSGSPGPDSRGLADKLKALEEQLAAERKAKDEVTLSLAEAERRLAEQRVSLSQAKTRREEGREELPAANAITGSSRSKAAKPLPHELRPSPKKGALFCPDWDLERLPCRSAAQVFRAWESAFNVKLPLEGYPSQYCMAFLVILNLEKQKQLFMLFRLRQTKYTLVCVPAKTPDDEAALQKTIAEGLKFLKLSGFEMEEMAVENIDSTLGSYFTEA